MSFALDIRLIAWVLFVLTPPVQGPGGAVSGQVSREPPATRLVIATKRTDPVPVVFLRHVGPYWTVGPVLARVADYMRAHHQSGPMFVKYLHDSGRPAAWSRRSEVGFVVTGDLHPEPPFERSGRGSEWVAYMTVEGQAATPRQHHEAIRAWMREHGYEAVGPVIEFYHAAPQGNASGTRRTEIQIPFRFEESVTSAEIHAPAAVAPSPPVPGRPAEGPSPPTLSPSDAPERKRIVAPSIDVDITELAPKSETSADEPKPPPQRDTNAPDPLATLVAAGRYDQVAERLIPDRLAMPATLRVWIGQVVYRIGAAAKGVERMYPGQGEVAIALADAIEQRYEEVSAAFKLDPLGEALVRIGALSAPHTREAHAIMLDLDTLLGLIAVRGVDAATVVDGLTDTIERAADLLSAAGSVESGGT